MRERAFLGGVFVFGMLVAAIGALIVRYSLDVPRTADSERTIGASTAPVQLIQSSDPLTLLPKAPAGVPREEGGQAVTLADPALREPVSSTISAPRGASKEVSRTIEPASAITIVRGSVQRVNTVGKPQVSGARIIQLRSAASE
ncbi:MAG TPA: hypothetical protein VHN11_12160 [Xanthobacteraceae bacterium]|jgi:hypothetical protein|nr:hypothetical protein [Xanthobacteraceae bacterium]